MRSATGRARRCTTNGTIRYLVDTNILLYAYDTAELSRRPRSLALLRLLGSVQRGALSSQILGEFYWNATRKLRSPITPDQAEFNVELWVRSWTVFVITPAIVLEAVRGARQYQFPYWDALIWATAKVNFVPTVLSEDFSDGALYEGVRIRNPLPDGFDLSAL